MIQGVVHSVVNPLIKGITGRQGSIFPSILTDGTTSMRWVERDGYMHIDKTLTPLGFAGIENTDWESDRAFNVIPTSEMILDSFADRIVLWTSKSNEKAGYYVNEIGDQEREIVLEDSVAGIVHSGRAILYDGSKTQYSATPANTPTNFRLTTNSVTISFWLKMTVKPTGGNYGLVYGTHSTTNGAYSAIVASTGIMSFYCRHSGGTIFYNTNVDMADSEWHHYCVIMNKTGNWQVFIDNVLLDTQDISGLTFGNYANVFNIGGQATYHTGTRIYRDIRLFSSAIDTNDVETLYNQEYVSGITSWWFCERGNESSVYGLKDCVGSNHLTNYNFDASSLVTGAWKSLLNRYGYSGMSYLGADIVLYGDFSDAARWTVGAASRFEVTGGSAWYKAVDALLPTCTSNNTISFVTGNTYRISYEITLGATATFSLKIGLVDIVAEAAHAVGVYTVIFLAPANGTLIITGNHLGGAFKIDNITIKQLEAGYISPLMSSGSPSTDVFSRALTFIGQAKFNLIKVDEDTVYMPDKIGEIYNACEQILTDDWYDANGDGNEIDLIDINAYETKRQYYRASEEELIILKNDVILTDEEDRTLKIYTRNSSSAFQYTIDVAKGLLTGTTANIYGTTRALLDSDAPTTPESIAPLTSDLNPANNYVAMGWADFFNTDWLYTNPLVAKYTPSYKFASTFYRQIKPLTADPLESAYSRTEIAKIENSGSFDGHHSLFCHVAYLSSHPEYDGRNTPSDNDLTVARADGTNEWGHDVDDTVSTSLGSVANDWLGLTAGVQATAWKNLTGANCATIRKSLSAFGLIVYGAYGEKILESMDTLSNRYCGTTGYSVLGGDYTTRTPNTVGGVEPDAAHLIQGGIFQGSASTKNHEIWERLVIIIKAYKAEFENKTKWDYFWSSSGGNTLGLYYKPESGTQIYVDKAYTKLPTGAVEYTSSITSISRSLIDVLRAAGFLTTMATQGDGYADNYDGLTRLEAQRTYKKNGLKKPDNVGDGFTYDLRMWDASIPAVDQESLLLEVDLVKALYDYAHDGAQYVGIAETTSPSPLDKVINAVTKYNAWGICPAFNADSGCSGDDISSYILALEAFYQFCVRAGITVISHEQAVYMGVNNFLPTGHNYFPNNSLATTVKTITNAVNAIEYPDGWNGGVVISEDTGSGSVSVLHIASDGIIFTRQYAIKNGTFSLSFKAKGIGTLKVRKITNNDTYNNSTGSAFTEINSITINSPSGYVEYTDSVSIPNEALESYSAPATPAEEAYQNYMKGYGDKICGIQIELVIAGGNYVKIGNLNLS